MQEFSRSQRGAKFFDHDIPRLIDALNRHTEAIEKLMEKPSDLTTSQVLDLRRDALERIAKNKAEKISDPSS